MMRVKGRQMYVRSYFRSSWPPPPHTKLIWAYVYILILCAVLVTFNRCRRGKHCAPFLHPSASRRNNQTVYLFVCVLPFHPAYTYTQCVTLCIYLCFFPILRQHIVCSVLLLHAISTGAPLYFFAQHYHLVFIIYHLHNWPVITFKLVYIINTLASVNAKASEII